jgi:hypothetical protein
LAIDPTYSKGVSQAIPSHSDCHGTTRIMPKRGPTSGKDALGEHIASISSSSQPSRLRILICSSSVIFTDFALPGVRDS